MINKQARPAGRWILGAIIIFMFVLGGLAYVYIGTQITETTLSKGALQLTIMSGIIGVVCHLGVGFFTFLLGIGDGVPQTKTAG